MPKQKQGVQSVVPPEDVSSLLEAKLATSGLTLADANALFITCTDAPGTRALSPAFWPVPTMAFRYVDVDGVTPLRGGQGWPDYFRVRWLRSPLPRDDGREPPKYLQPPGTRPHAYFPRNVPGGWSALAADYREPIVITEGELKAAKACKEGFPTIGLGGVHSFKGVRSSGVAFLPELERFVWPRREVTICFDADVTTNDNVRRALMDLAQELLDRGAVPKLLILPSLDGEKTGLDDFLIKRTPDQLRALMDSESEFLTLARDLWNLNKHWTWVDDVQRAAVLSTGRLLKAAEMPTSITSFYEERVLMANGNLSYRKVNAAAPWLAWPLRSHVDRLDYDPRHPPLSIIEPEPGVFTYNLWTGWGCEPVAGDVSLFMELLRHQFQESEPGILHYLLCWLAYPLQHPGFKMATAFILVSLAHGTGKSFIGYTMQYIYGKNFKEIGEGSFNTDFNAWAVHKQFIMGDDITGNNKKMDRERLKTLTTQRVLSVNVKHQPQYEIRDTINYLWTTNQPDAFQLEDNDRRFVVHAIMVEKLPAEFYVRYDNWLLAGGARHVFRYLLDYDTTGFNPFDHAPYTQAKAEMTAYGYNDVGAWARRLRSDFQAVLRTGDIPYDMDVITPADIKAFYDMANPDRPISAQFLGRELGKIGFPFANDGKPIKSPDGQVHRYYILRNHDTWRRSCPAELVAYLFPKHKARERRFTRKTKLERS